MEDSYDTLQCMDMKHDPLQNMCIRMTTQRDYKIILESKLVYVSLYNNKTMIQ